MSLLTQIIKIINLRNSLKQKHDQKHEDNCWLKIAVFM